MNLSDMRSGEVSLLNKQLKRTVRLCKAIYANAEYIVSIKDALNGDDLVYAGQLFHELDFEDQRLLMMAPSKGGPFTTKERGILRDVWEVSPDDLEGV